MDDENSNRLPADPTNIVPMQRLRVAAMAVSYDADVNVDDDPGRMELGDDGLWLTIVVAVVDVASVNDALEN